MILKRVGFHDLSVAASRLEDPSRIMPAPKENGPGKIFIAIFRSDETFDAEFIIQDAAIIILDHHKIEYDHYSYEDNEENIVYTGVVIEKAQLPKLLAAIENEGYIYGMFANCAKR